METQKDLKDTDGVNLLESTELAIDKRKFLLKGKLRSRKIFPRMKVHTIKYLKIAMICSVIRFAENGGVNKIVILLP